MEERKKGAQNYDYKFVALSNPGNVSRLRRNYFIWITSLTVLVGIVIGFVFFKFSIAPHYFENPETDVENDNYSGLNNHSFSKLINAKEVIATYRKKLHKDESEFLCEQSQEVEAIPVKYREKIIEKLNFENLDQFINVDLLLHYERIINKYEPKYLKSVFNKYQHELLSIQKSSDFLRVLNSNKFRYYAALIKEQKYKLNLTEFDWFFGLTEEMNFWYNYLHRLPSLLSDYKQQKENYYITGKNFQNFTMETQKNLFHYYYPFSISKKKIQEINDVIVEWKKPLQVEINGSSVIFFNKAVKLSEVNEFMSSFNATLVKNVYVFASQIVYLDEDIEMFGVNVAIIAPIWKFLKKIQINLNGVSGKDGVGRTNDAGEPGNPGGNAGDFFGVGSFHEKYLSISTNGGAGGGGGNGTKGRDGLDFTIPARLIEKPTCLSKLNTFRNSFNQSITHYKIYNEKGCGHPGTDGGVGGQGGQGGLITLINNNSVKIIRGLNGSLGRPGKGGPGGKGGRDGAFYEVFDVDDEIIHPVTTLKSEPGNILPSGKPGKDNQNTLGQRFPPGKENLLKSDCVFHFIRLAGNDFVKSNNPHVISLLKELNTHGGVAGAFRKFELLEMFDKIELYELLRENLEPTDFIFNSLVLGKMTILKGNINYFFIDSKNYLDVIKKSINNVNENTRELKPVSYLLKKFEIKTGKIIQNLENLKSEVYLENTEDIISCSIVPIIDMITYFINRTPNSKLGDALEFCSPNNDTTRRYSCCKTKSKEAERLLENLENLMNKDEMEVKEHLMELNNALNALTESNVFLDEKKNFLQALNEELEHFIAIYKFLEWRDIVTLFLESLVNLNFNERFNSNVEIETAKTLLTNIMITIQYKMAEGAAQHNLYSLPHTKLLQSSQKKIIIEDAIRQINHLEDFGSENPFCRNQIKAVFDENSTVGEFYSWSKDEIKMDLRRLFSGAEINLKSNLINRHVLNKNFIQFTSLKLEFGGNETACEKLRKILFNFKIDMTHSGYSYYNYEGETYVTVSEKVSFSYSFKTRNSQEPEVYDDLFQKFQNGEIRLSPYTTWTLRLLPINDEGDFSLLTPFVGFVDLLLTGTGTYTF